METNENPAQEHSVQPISPKPLYNPAEVAQIVACLTSEFLDPEYILLFGRLAGGTPHSDIAAYDLLVVVRDTPEHDWLHAKQLLRYKLPPRSREVTYVNPYIVTLRQVESAKTPFLYLAHAEGEVLYCRDSYSFRRPRRSINFASAYVDAKRHFETFHTLGGDFAERAHRELAEGGNRRLAALLTAQAAVCFYHTLYYVYHGQAFASRDPMRMHERMRTLSAALMLTLDNTHTEWVSTLPLLGRFLEQAGCQVAFDIAPGELAMHLQRVKTLGGIVGVRCGERLRRYRELGEGL